MDGLTQPHIPEKYAYCEWVSCEAYLGHQTKNDYECRSPSDLARLAADLCRQHLLGGRRGGQEVYTRVIPQNIRLRVTSQCDDVGNREEILDKELEIVNIARCSTGHDPFPQIVVIVYCVGIRTTQADDAECRQRSAASGPPLEMRCHGIACANAWIASRLAKTISSAFEDSRMQPSHGIYLPRALPQTRQISRNSVLSTLAAAAPPAYQAPAARETCRRGCDAFGSSGHHQSSMKEKKGLPEVGAL